MDHRQYKAIKYIARCFVGLLCCSLSLPCLAGQGLFSFGDREDSILAVDQAFQVTAMLSEPHTLTIRWQIAPGYYLYHDKFSLRSLSESVHLSAFKAPPGQSKHDPAFGVVEVHYHEISITAPLSLPAQSMPTFAVEVGYQGCKENTVCYPPVLKQLTIDTATVIARGDSSAPDISQSTTSDSLSKSLSERHFIVNMALFFGLGFLLSLTPCIFPMIPILSGLIVAKHQAALPYRPFFLSIAYVLAMAFMYAVLGALAGLFGINFQAQAQNIWVIAGVSIIFVLLALSMFGFYELQLPSRWQTRIAGVADGQPIGTMRGAAIMGAVSAVIVGPCMAPPLAASLLYISQTGNALLGGMILFSMGLGFGVPLLIIGASSGHLLPKAGRWMQIVKNVFGVFMLAIAIWFLERVAPPRITLFLWSMLLIVSAVYMGAFERAAMGASWSKLWKGIGLLLMLYGVILLVGSVSGGRDIWRPLPDFSLKQNIHSTEFAHIKDMQQLQEQLTQAQIAARPVMVVFYADWCVVCKKIEHTTLQDAGVRSLLNQFALIRADVTVNNRSTQDLLQQFALFGPPALLFFDRNGQEIVAYRTIGFIAAQDLIAIMNELI